MANLLSLTSKLFISLQYQTSYVSVKKINELTLFSESDTNSRADKPVALISGSNWNSKCRCLWREENRRTRRKTLGAGTRTNNKLNPRMILGPGIELSHSGRRRVLMWNRPFYSCVLSYLAMNASETGGDLALIQSSQLFSCKCQLVSMRTT